ncbi:hypothetical protein NEMBOFW57_009161 [Staphylotrichum longicolle]|uniref:Class II aldolase/adducin N-terminal domain-containing protein n=1 Tax=Staphylotrichum longicolle TaxID=669026 RepID=A0AAD4ESP8_9PEZI|nr:hypothetical protein NEMBOFW57_009161 [Staphylotrichum longicolle]
MVSTNLTELLAAYINALHILHRHGVLDGFGHLSVRNPNNPPTFFMVHAIAPALVSGLDDISEYRISDAKPVNPDDPAGPIERFIHSEVLKRYADVNVVLHGHPPELITYGVSSVKFRPVFHGAAFLGEHVPIFDITKHYQPNDTQDFLVSNQRLGAALAAEFDDTSSSTCGVAQDACVDHSDDGPNRNSDSNHDDDRSGYPGHNLVLMRSHGFAAVATDIKIATFEGINAVANAEIQSKALTMQHAYTGQAAQGENGVAYLNQRQIRDTQQTMLSVVERPWELWVREVKVNPLYVNELDPEY